MKKSFLIGSITTLALIPISHAALLFGVTNDNRLVSFDTANPSSFQSATGITGLFGADGTTPDPSGAIVNLAARLGPTAGSVQFWGLDGNANMYRIALDGNATLVASGFSPSGFSAGFSYDPFNDNLVYAGDDAQSVSLALNGTPTANMNLTYAGGGTPSIFGLGIDMAFGTAFAIDATNDSLSTTTNPLFPSGNGELTLVGGLGVDVVSYGGLTVDEDGNLFASLSTDGNTSGLYSIDGTSGTASLIGNFGTGVGMNAIAVPEPSATLLGALGALFLVRRRRA
jgi:hypothetical protein